MVMYASKHPRLSDGFHEKNEAHAYHPMDNYPHKKRERDSINRDRKDSKERPSKESPRISSGGNSNNSSPRYNSSRSGSAYAQKPRQKGSSGSSPYQNTSNHHPSPNRPNSLPPSNHEKRIKEILARAAEWTDHISSSGKKYYYNCRTEVSQWEKPKEWIEREKLQKALGGKLPSLVANPNAQMQSKGNEKHSSDSKPQSSSQHQHSHKTQDKSSSSSHSASRRQSNSQSSQSRTQTNLSPHSKLNQTDSRTNQLQVRQTNLSEQSQSTPTKESRNNHSSRSGNNDVPHDKERSADHSPSLNRKLSEGSRTDHAQRDSPGSNRARNVSLATDMYGRLKNLVSGGPSGIRTESPRIQNTPSPAPTVSPLPTPSPKLTRTPVYINQHYPQRQRRKSSSRSPSIERVRHSSNSERKEGHDRNSTQSPMSIASVSDLSSPAHSQPSPHSVTSTPLSCSSQHVAETQEEDMEITTEITKDIPPDKGKGDVIPDIMVIAEEKIQEKAEVVEMREEEKRNKMDLKVPATNISSSESEPPAVVQEVPVQKHKDEQIHFKDVPLSSSAHIVFFKEELIRHQSQWPSDQIERQAQIVSRESYRLGVESYSQVTMDLKFARSLVRTTEIQANIQESRILFLRQQANDLMKLKNENAYMA